VKTNSFIVFL